MMQLQKEAARQPETVVFAIESFDAVAVRRAKAFEAAMFEWMIEVKALIVRPVVVAPMVITDMRSGNNVAALAALGFRLRARLTARGRCLWNVPLVRTRGILLAFVAGVARIPAELEKGSEQME